MGPKKPAQPQTAMAVLGDSISAATFAQTQLATSAESSLEFFSLEANKNRFKWPEIPWIVQNKKTYSWASGNKNESHYRRLHYYFKLHGFGKSLAVLNVARPGGTSDTLPYQIADLKKALEKGKIDSISYVTLLIGGNDLCDLGTDDEISLSQFKSYVVRALSEIAKLRSSDQIHILVSSIPNIPDIGRPEIFQQKTWFGMTCENLRRHLVTYCNKMTLWETPDEYRLRVEQVRSRNGMLREAIEELRANQPQVDVYFSDTLFEKGAFFAEHLAFDCFHPSHEGQALISRLLWDDQPWFR